MRHQDTMQRFGICFVCLGNICRSPLAEAVLAHQAKVRGLSGQLQIASRGTGDWHLGGPADPRMRATASRHGITLHSKAELFEPEDFATFDLILCMDRARLEELEPRTPPGGRARLGLFRDHDPSGGDDGDVPDPYYGQEDGFEEVYQIVERTCAALLDRLARGELP